MAKPRLPLNLVRSTHSSVYNVCYALKLRTSVCELTILRDSVSLLQVVLRPPNVRTVWTVRTRRRGQFDSTGSCLEMQQIMTQNLRFRIAEIYKKSLESHVPATLGCFTQDSGTGSHSPLQHSWTVSGGPKRILST